MAEYIEREAVDWDVTHWMPLPEPPKEAEKRAMKKIIQIVLKLWI